MTPTESKARAFLDRLTEATENLFGLNAKSTGYELTKDDENILREWDAVLGNLPELIRTLLEDRKRLIEALELIKNRPDLPNPEKDADWKNCMKNSSYDASKAIEESWNILAELGEK